MSYVEASVHENGLWAAALFDDGALRRSHEPHSKAPERRALILCTDITAD
jgi:hypothetical protein